MRKKAIATVCMSGSLADKLAAAAEAGFDGVEIFENDLTYFDGRPEDVRELAASLGLEIVALQPFRDFEGLPEPLRARAFDRARRKFELMNRLGTLAPPGVQQRRRPTRSTTRPASPPTCTSWATSPERMASRRIRGPVLGPAHQ